MSADIGNSVLEQIAAAERLDALLSLWRGRVPEHWNASAETYLAFARRAISLGEPLIGFDAAEEGLRRWPEHLGLRVVKGLAWARCGASEDANAWLGALIARGGGDDELLGIYARTFKDLWLAEPQQKLAAGYLTRARDLYQQAYERGGNPWLGVNAATLAVAQGDQPSARALAEAVRRVVAEGGDYWSWATLGEAELILGNPEAAAAAYRRALASPGCGAGDIASSRRNLKLLIRYGGLDPTLLDRLLPAPRVAVFSGHLPDEPERAPARLSPAGESAVREALTRRLRERNVSVGYAAAAAGGDILFLETLLALGGELNIVLPFPAGRFVPVSVARGADRRWVERFQRVLAAAASVTCAAEAYTGTVSFAYGNLMMFGLARARARQLDAELDAIAVWDGQDGGAGGTGSNVRGWRASGQAVYVLEPDGGRAYCLEAEPGTAVGYWRAAGGGDESSRLVAFLFADVVGYSKLAEAQILPFVEHFLGLVAGLCEAGPAPLFRNTWGDGLYFVFADSQDAAAFALNLSERMRETDWAARGLPAELSIRIALHAGPAYQVHDPVIGRETYTGSHVSRAARMEPITPPGQVYCSDAFVALSEADGADGFRCRYVGQTPLAKGFGTFPAYRVTRR